MYIVAATGGFEEPIFIAFQDSAEAIDCFNGWSADLVNEPGDRVDLLLIESDNKALIIDSFVWDED